MHSSDSDSDLHIGKVKWFRNQSTGGDYGFINDRLNGDAFFHISNAFDSSYQENDYVVYYLRKSKKHEDKFEAYDVRKVSTLNNFDLLSQLCFCYDNEYKRVLGNQFKRLLKIGLSEQQIDLARDKIIRFFDCYLFTDQYTSFDIEKYRLYCSELEYFFDKDGSFEQITKFLTPIIKFFLFLGGFTSKYDEEILIKYYRMCSPELKKLCADKVSADTRINLLRIDVSTLSSNATYLECESLLSQINSLRINGSEETFEHLGLLTSFWAKCPKLINVQLWVNDVFTVVELNDIVEVFKDLDSEQQEQCFFKSYFTFCATNRDLHLSFVSDLVHSSAIKSLELFLALFILNNHVSNKRITYYDLIPIILKTLSESSCVELHGKVFETCSGRTHIVDGVKVQNRHFSTPRFCEGRKARNKESDEALLEEGFEYYWCRNHRCFENMLKPHSVVDGFGEGFFAVMQCEGMSEDQYALLMGIINKIYTYIEHLKCRNCGGWLTGKKQSNYAYDRINHFFCGNEKCCHYQNEIYISHCLNPHCFSVVDSRDSKKCPHGWYICTSCLGCCSTEKLKVRAGIVGDVTGKSFTTKLGHDELNEIFCPQCGYKINQQRTNTAEKLKYKKRLDQLKGNKERIPKSGIDKFGRPWYLFRKLANETDIQFKHVIESIRSVGLTVNEAKMRNSYLIGDSDKDALILKCSNAICHFQLNLNDELLANRDRVRALCYHRTINEFYGLTIYPKK